MHLGGKRYVYERGSREQPGRPACETGHVFHPESNEFKSSIWVEKDERKVNAKSLLGVLSLGIVKGTPIKLIADGPDEKEAVEALYKMISSDFSE